MEPIANACLRHALIIVCLGWTLSGAADSNDDRLEQIKAGYLINFMRFTQWAGDAFDSGESPILVAVIGPNPFSDSVQRTLETTVIGDRSLQFNFLPIPDDAAMANVHVVYLAGLAPALASDLIASLPKQVLSVGDRVALVDVGVMLTLAIESNGVVFFANANAIRDSAISLSSKVLRLARKWEGG